MLLVTYIVTLLMQLSSLIQDVQIKSCHFTVLPILQERNNIHVSEIRIKNQK